MTVLCIFRRIFVVILQKTALLIFTAPQPSSLTFGLLLSPRIVLRLSQWSRGLRRRSAVAHLLRLWVRIPPGAWMFVGCECCVLSGRGLCDELITRPEESYRMWCVVMYDLETLWMRRSWPTGGFCVQRENKCIVLHLAVYLLPNIMFFCRSYNDKACCCVRRRMS